MRRILYALSALVLAVSLAPEPAFADSRAEARRYFGRGMAAIREGRHQEGVELLLKAYEIRPHPNVLFNVARAYLALGNLDEAESYFRRYLASGPPDAGDVRRALDDIETRQRLRGLVDDGMAAIAAGRHIEGVLLLQKAYEERPHANLLFNIARAFEEAGDLDAAAQNYQRYLASRPADAEEVEAKLAALKQRIGTMASRTPVEDRTERKPPRTTRDTTRDNARDSSSLDAEGEARRVADMILAMVQKGGAGGPSAGQVGPAHSDAATAVSTSTAAAAGLEEKKGAGYEEVVVTASRREQSPLDAPNAVTIITEEDIRLSGARSIPDLLRRVPGMDVMQMSYSDWNVSMRGFNRRLANKILVLVDGRTLYQDFVGAVLWKAQTFDLLDIERIEVVRGPGSAIYGAYAYTGIVNIITKRPEAIEGSVLSGAGGNGSAFEGTYQYGSRRGAVGIRASAGYDRGDKFDLEFDPDRVDYTTLVADPKKSLDRARFDATLDLQVEKGGRLFAGGGANVGQSELYGVSALRNQHVDGRFTNLRAGYDGELFSVLAFWDSTRVSSTPQFFRTGLASLGSRVRADTISVEPVYRPTFTLFGDHALVLGAEYRHKYIDWDYLDGPHEEDHFALFAQEAWTITGSFTALASARLDVHPLLGVLGSPRLALIFKPGEGQAIRASFGTAYRQPTPAENYLDLSASSPVAGVAINLVGSTELEPEQILTFDLGYLNQGELGELEVVGYFNRVDNLITRSPLIRSPINEGFNQELGAFIGARSFYLNEERVFFALGSEVAARVYPIDGVDVGVSYAFQYIYDRDSGERFTDSPLHKATLWGQFRTGFGLDASLSLHYVSSQDWIEPQFDSDDPSGFNTDPLRVDASVVVIGRVGYRLLGDKLELAVSGANLVDSGKSRHVEHPFANRVEARFLGSVIARF